MTRPSVVLYVALLLLSACGSAPAVATPGPTTVQAGGTLRVAIPAEVTTLDPWTADSASLVATRQVFETLVTVDPVTRATGPGLAASWQMSADGASWTFSLRGGISFHDGSPLDAASVVSSFERGRASSSFASLFDEPSTGLRTAAVDAQTVRFDLRTPYGPFLGRLASPQTAIARGGAGTGPFVASADALAPDGTLTLRRNESYWRRTPNGRSLPYLDAVVIHPVRDAAARLAELRSGRADLALDLPIAQAATARSDPNLRLVLRSDAFLASLGLDKTRPPFDRAEVRRAVAMTIDRGALSGIYFGFARSAAQVVPASTLGYDESVVEFAPLDPSGAKRLLAEARIATPLAVDLAYPAYPTGGYPDPQRIAQAIAADVGKLGIVARLRAVDSGSVRSAPAALTLETTPLGLEPDDAFWGLFASGAPAEGSLVLGLLRKARSETDTSKRAELYKQVSKISRTEATRVPLLFVDRPSAAASRVTGFTGDPNASFGTLWLRP